MNTLSIMLYAADVVGNAQSLFVLISIFGSIAYACFTLFYSLDASMNDHPRFHGAIWPVWVFLFCAIAATILPSRETVLLIAGSEAGEAVVTSDAGKRIMSQIEAAISAQLSELAGAK